MLSLLGGIEGIATMAHETELRSIPLHPAMHRSVKGTPLPLKTFTEQAWLKPEVRMLSLNEQSKRRHTESS
jgi:hypothetical protein